jgi:hypothetical protein
MMPCGETLSAVKTPLTIILVKGVFDFGLFKKYRIAAISSKLNRTDTS